MLPNGPAKIEEAPILWLRPRAFNMIEHHCMVNGKEVSGPLFDFALLMFHNAKRMHELKIGPYIYLSKVNLKLTYNIFILKLFKSQFIRLKIQPKAHYGTKYLYGHNDVYLYHKKPLKVSF